MPKPPLPSNARDAIAAQTFRASTSPSLLASGPVLALWRYAVGLPRPFLRKEASPDQLGVLRKPSQIIFQDQCFPARGGTTTPGTTIPAKTQSVSAPPPRRDNPQMRGRSLGVDTDFQAPSKRSQASSTCSATMGDDQEPLFRRAGWLMLGPLDSTRSGSAGACGSPCVANSRAGRRSRRCGSLPFAAGPRNGACHRPDYPKDAGTPATWRANSGLGSRPRTWSRSVTSSPPWTCSASAASSSTGAVAAASVGFRGAPDPGPCGP